MLAAILALLAAAMVGIGGAVAAADGASPGSILYGLDRATEQVRLGLAGSPESRAGLALQIAQERLLEAQHEAAQGDRQGLTAALDGYDAALGVLLGLVASGELDQAQTDVLLSTALPSQDALLIDLSAMGVEPGATACTDADGDGFDDTYPALPCATEEPVCDPLVDPACLDEDGDGQVTICHVTGSATNPNEEISISLEDVPDHLAHGDTVGPCEEQANTCTDADGDGIDDLTQEPCPDDDSDGSLEWCVGADPHPVGERLAEQFGVTYDEIMTRFCGGELADGTNVGRNGFGEIRLAYGMAEELGVPVDEIFALREGGLGWGQIMKEYGLIGNTGRGEGSNRVDDGDDVPPQGLVGPGRGNGPAGGGNGNAGGNGNGNRGGNGNTGGNGNAGGNGNGNGNGGGGGGRP